MLLNNLTFQHNDYKEVGLDLFQSKPLLRQEFIFHNFCYSFNSGITTLVAKNGVGKSTLIQCIVDEYILSLKNNGSGMVVFETKATLKHISQTPDHSLFPWYNSIDNLKVIASFEKRTVDLEKYTANLEQFKINPTQKIESLSGGQKQIVNILKTLAFEPNLILMDEPFSALDLENSIRLKKLILEWQKEHQAMIFLISHSIDDISSLSDTILILDKRPVEIYSVLENSLELRERNRVEIMKFLDPETSSG